MSQQKEDRARQKFSDKMRQKSLTARNAKLAAKQRRHKAAPADADACKRTDRPPYPRKPSRLRSCAPVRDWAKGIPAAQQLAVFIFIRDHNRCTISPCEPWP